MKCKISTLTEYGWIATSVTSGIDKQNCMDNFIARHFSNKLHNFNSYRNSAGDTVVIQYSMFPDSIYPSVKVGENRFKSLFRAEEVK